MGTQPHTVYTLSNTQNPFGYWGKDNTTQDNTEVKVNYNDNQLLEDLPDLLINMKLLTNLKKENQWNFK